MSFRNVRWGVGEVGEPWVVEAKNEHPCVLQFDLHVKRKHQKKQFHLKDMIYVQL